MEESTFSSEAVQGKRKSPKHSDKAKRIKYEPIPNGALTRGKRKNNLYKPPTIDEINNLKITENLYNSNLFRLQIEELVKEVSIKNKRRKAFDSWLENFKISFDNLAGFHEIKSSAIRHKCPYQTDQDVSLKWQKPEKIECFGLYDNNALPGPHLEALVNVTIPKGCFHVKDFLNNRYLVKRFYYLAYIGQNVTAYKMSMVCHESNPLWTTVHIQPTDDKKLTVKIYASPSQDYFKPSRLLPNQNNVKQDLFNDKIGDIETLKTASSILYNSALAYDITLSENSAFVKATLEAHNNVQEGIKLLSIWLKQRGLDVGYGALTSNLVIYLMVYLLSKKKLNKFMSSYQVIRNFWTFMLDFADPICLGEGSVELFKQYFDLVFVDKTGCYNLMAFLDVNLFKKFQTECQMALRHLDDNKVESFHYLFLAKLPLALQYDLLLDVSEALPLEGVLFTSDDNDKAKHVGYNQFQSIKKLWGILHKALSRRVLHIVPYIDVTYSQAPMKKVLFGINLNPETAFNFIELGPALNDFAAAEEFRTFWGYLSSDRRFRDGSTNVAVYFKTTTFRGKRGIIKRIIKYLFTEKFNIKFTLYYDEFEEFLVNKKVESPYPVGTNEEGSLKVITIADELGQKTRSIPMSLSITGIQGISDVFSYSEVFPPIAAKFKPAEQAMDVKGKKAIFSNKKFGMMPRYVEPVELVLQMEHSSKWPNSLEAIKHVKTSFYLEISKMLQESHSIISNVTKDSLEVFYQGLVFRYRLYVPKEIALMKKALTESGLTTYLDNIRSEIYEKTLSVLPKVNSTLKGLQLQHPSFGPGTALIKRWLRCHLIDYFHFPDMAVNLLNASLYVNSTGFPESCTPQISFIRFLKFISELQWELQPVIVNFNDEISKEDLARFQQHRDTAQPLYVIIPYDQGQSLFTKTNPSKEILNRVQQLAEATLDLIVARVMNQNCFELKELFKPNMAGYNLLIHLRPLMNPRRHEQLDNLSDSKIVLEQYEQHPSEKIPITGFNPVDLYLRTLRENYGEFANFFHDTYGGNTVAVLWNPEAREVREFKVGYVNGRRLEDGKLVFNEEAIIEDFYTLGKGVVKWIEKK